MLFLLQKKFTLRKDYIKKKIYKKSIENKKDKESFLFRTGR